jgi:competence protein ComEC
MMCLLLLGTLALLTLPALPPPWVVIAAAVVTLSSYAMRRTLRPALALCPFGVGFLYAALHAHLYLEQRWPDSRTDDRVIAEVIVDTVPAARGGDWSFDGEVMIEAPERATRPLRVRLIWRDAESRPRAGERWRLLLSLRPPRARVNPGAVDLERILFHDRVHALGSVLNSAITRRIDAEHRPLTALRERIALHIDERVPDREAAALIAALAVGVTGEMSREQWRVFNATGTTHLVAISGLHVTLFAVVSMAAARWLWSLVLWRAIRLPRDTFAAVVGFIAAMSYACLTGLSVPTQRTLVMLGIWLFTRSLARVSPPFHSIALALGAVLILDPFAPLAPGFWLSFAAMAAIILVTSPRLARRPAVLEAVAVQGAVSVALIPMTLAAFGSVSLIGPLVNVAAIPAMSWVFVPVILLSVVLGPIAPSAADAVLALATWMHHVGWPWLVAAANVPWALIHVNPPWWWYAVAGAGVLISLLPLPRPMRWGAVIWLAPLALAGIATPPIGRAQITVLDAGEGTAIVAQTAHHVLVFGTGDVYGSEGRTAETVLIPFLRSRGVAVIDRLIVSERTPAATSGIAAMLAEMPVRESLLNSAMPADFDGARHCKAESWTWDEVLFRTLPAGASVSGTDAAAATGCLVKVETLAGRLLISGDIDGRSEQRLAGEALAADVVIVPRHGSDSASTPDFIRAVGARWAVVSGRRERAGRTKAAVARWEANGATVVATADLGAIAFDVGGERGLLAPRGERSSRRHLWRSP